MSGWWWATKTYEILLLGEIRFTGISIEIPKGDISSFSRSWIDWYGIMNLFFQFFANKSEFSWRIAEYMRLQWLSFD